MGKSYLSVPLWRLCHCHAVVDQQLGKLCLLSQKSFPKITSSPFLISLIALSDRISPNLDNIMKIVDPMIRK